jgi:hypothetical protein
MVVQSYTPWLLFVRSNERYTLQRQSSHSPWTERGYHKFHQEHPSDWIVTCLCKQDKTWRCVSTSRCGPFPNVFILMYRDSLNILIIYSRRTGTFGSLCILPKCFESKLTVIFSQNLSKSTDAGKYVQKHTLPLIMVLSSHLEGSILCKATRRSAGVRGDVRFAPSEGVPSNLRMNNGISDWSQTQIIKLYKITTKISGHLAMPESVLCINSLQY